MTRSLAPYKSNGSELPNMEVLSLFRQTTCSASASIHYNTLKVCKIYSYSDSRKIVKMPIVLFSSSASFSFSFSSFFFSSNDLLRNWG